jgi:hypothetical protein
MAISILAMLVALGLVFSFGTAPGMAQSAGDPVSGIVAEANGEEVRLTSGASFPVNSQTRVTLVRSATPADLLPGYYVAITARPDLDGKLIASIISTFPEEQRGTGEGQRPMEGENLMTNANIDDAVVDTVTGAELQVSFLGQSANVRITPETRVEIRTLGGMEDIVPGVNVTGLVVDGVARTVQVR